MSAKATGIVWESALERPEKYVLLAMADHAKEDGTDVRPSLWRIIWKTGYSETQVRDIIRSLIRQEILILTHKGGKCDGDVNIYRIDYQALPMLKEFKEWSAERRAEEKKPAIQEGTETAPSGVRKPHPQEGTVQPKMRVRFSENEGTVATAPKPSTNRTKSYIEGNSASELPDFALTEPANTGPTEAELKVKDQRFPEICEAIRKCWPKGEGYKCDITPADAGAINRMLAKNHAWKAEELAVCIVARFMSVNVNPTESVKAWIGAVTDYQSGPQDKYGKPQYAGPELNQWRNQARTILYGPQPEQMRLKSAATRPPVQLPSDFDRNYSVEYGTSLSPNNRKITVSPWTLILGNVEKNISRHTYDTWFKPTKYFGVWRQRIYVIVPSTEFSWLWETYGSVIWPHLPEGFKGVEFVTTEQIESGELWKVQVPA